MDDSEDVVILMVYEIEGMKREKVSGTRAVRKLVLFLFCGKRK